MTSVTEGPRDVESVRRRLTAALTPGYGRGEAEAMTRLIFFALKGWSATDLLIHADTQVSDLTMRRLEEILSRLERHEPLQYILGAARFYGMDLKVTPDVLIPRPETEELVDLIVKRWGDRKEMRVLDIGTGSGAIAIALARFLPFSEVDAVDISERALDVARENAETLQAHIRLLHKDIFLWEPPADTYDIIVSNPPYVCECEKRDMEPNVLLYEPEGALFVPDSDPLLYYRRIAEVSLRALKPGGMVYFEINPLYAAELQHMMQDLGYTDVIIERDISRRDRFLISGSPRA